MLGENMDNLQELQNELMQEMMKAAAEHARLSVNPIGGIEVEFPQPRLIQKGDNWYMQLYFPE